MQTARRGLSPGTSHFPALLAPRTKAGFPHPATSLPAKEEQARQGQQWPGCLCGGPGSQGGKEGGCQTEPCQWLIVSILQLHIFL